MAPVWGWPRGLRCFCQSQFTEKTREFNSVLEMYRSYLKRGERMALYAFWSWHVAFQAPLDLKTRGVLTTLHLEGRYSSGL